MNNTFFFFANKKRKKKSWANRKRYVYRIDSPVSYKRKRKHNWKWVSVRIIRLYFLTIKDKQFRKLFKKASKLDGNLESNYCHLIEGRILHVLYRTNFLTNLFTTMDFIKYGNVLLNNLTVNFINILVNIGTIITLKQQWKKLLYKDLRKRVLIRAILFNTPKYMQVSFRLAYAILLKKPIKKDLVYPVRIDIQRITGFY